MYAETLRYEADGLSMVGQLFRPARATGRRPGVLVFPEAFGLGKHALAAAAEIAKLGYVALACDLHGEAREITDLQEVMSVVTALAADSRRPRARAKGALDVLIAQAGIDASRTAAIGYCFGGTMAIQLACAGADIAAVAGFHSGLSSIDLGDLGSIKGRLLLCLGADDPAITAEHRMGFEAGLRKAGVRWDLHLYGNVVHSFTNPEADSLGRPDFARYDERADTESFEALRRLLAETLGK